LTGAASSARSCLVELSRHGPALPLRDELLRLLESEREYPPLRLAQIDLVLLHVGYLAAAGIDPDAAQAKIELALQSLVADGKVRQVSHRGSTAYKIRLDGGGEKA